MKKLILALLLAAVFARAESFDAKTAPFDSLYSNSQRAGDTPEHAAIRDAAYKELLARGPETLSNLMDRIHIENVMIGVYAIQLTRSWPIPKEQAMPVLASYYKAERDVTRKMAAFLSGFYRAPEYADQIYPLLDHEKTKGAAIRALGKWQVTNALPRIAAFLHDDKERVRVATANALRDIGDPRAIQPLIGALGDPLYSVRNTAARALVSFGSAAVTPVMAALELAKTDAATRRQLIRCLGDLKDERAVIALKPLAGKSDYETSADAQHALDLISGKRTDIWFGPGGE